MRLLTLRNPGQGVVVLQGAAARGCEDSRASRSPRVRSQVPLEEAVEGEGDGKGGG